MSMPVPDRQPPRKVLVATDFSESSRHALRAALAYFPAAQVMLLHAFEVPYVHTGEDLAGRYRQQVLATAEQFLAASALATQDARRVTLCLEEGAPATVVRREVAAQHIDLVVIASHGQSAVFEILVGSTARRVMEAAPGDVLLVRDPRASGAR